VLGRMGFDFFLALVQAVTFGFSMLMPGLFPLFLSLLLLATTRRGSIEHRDFVEKMWDKLTPQSKYKQGERSDRMKRKAFRRDLDAYLRGCKFLKVWSSLTWVK